MNIEQTRRERFIQYAAHLRERFQSGMLAELQSLPQWVVWKRSFEDGAWRKPPYNPNYRNARASSKIAKSWGTLDTALTALASGKFQGLGFVVTSQDPFCYIDFDQCVNVAERTIAPGAREIVDTFHSYTELSPSGTGLHIFVKATLPATGIHTDIEMYDRDHYVTITTQHAQSTPLAIEDRQAQVLALYEQHKPEGKGIEARILGVVDELVAPFPMNQAERVMGKPPAGGGHVFHELLSGREGYTQAMSLKFPDVYEWEIQIALLHHRCGGTLESLREITP